VEALLRLQSRVLAVQKISQFQSPAVLCSWDIEALGRKLGDLFVNATSSDPNVTMKACGEYALVQLLAARVSHQAYVSCEFDWAAAVATVPNSDSEKVALECLRLGRAPPKGLYRDDSFEGFWLEKAERTDEDWRKLSLMYLYKSATEGLDDQLAYDLAHLGFYWTDFGTRRSECNEFGALGALLIASLESLSADEHDLRAEIFLALISMKLVFGNSAIENKLEIFMGDMAIEYSKNCFFIAHRQISRCSNLYWYSCFHTSCLMFVLSLMTEQHFGKFSENVV